MSRQCKLGCKFGGKSCNKCVNAQFVACRDRACDQTVFACSLDPAPLCDRCKAWHQAWQEYSERKCNAS